MIDGVETTTRHRTQDSEFNADMARRFRLAESLLEAQNADPYRRLAYRHGADALDTLDEPASTIYRHYGLAGLIAVPAIGRRLARAIAEVVEFGHWRWLDRLQGDVDPEKVLTTIPAIGTKLAHRLHTELGIESLEDLERAVYDGRLGRMRSIGDKRWHAIRDALVARLHAEREEHRDPVVDPPCSPTIELLLDIDEEYRTKADLNALATIAPQRHNPTGAHWLPVLHTIRNGHHYTAMFSNTARAHELGMFTVLWCYLRNSEFKVGKTDYHASADLTGQANHIGVTIGADIIKQKLPENNGGFTAVGTGKTHDRVYDELTTDHPIDLTRWQVANCYMGRVGLINSGGASGGESDLAEAVTTAVINKRAGGCGLISGRKAFQRPMAEGVELLNAIQDVYLDGDISIA